MKYPHLVVFAVLVFTNFAVAAVPAEIEPSSIGAELFLQACGGNPQQYFAEGKVVEGIAIEVPNKVTALDVSPYGRPFTSRAESKIRLDSGQDLTAELTNFRDLTVKNDSGEILYSRKISGAASIYEVMHGGKTIAWGTGWHNYCREYYKNTEFTVFRVILPQVTNDSVQIVDRVFNGGYTIKYEDELKTSPIPLMMQSDDVYNGSCCSCFYCLPRFFTLSQSSGFSELKSPRELESLGMDLTKVDALMYVPWLSQYGLLTDLAAYLAQNYDAVARDANGIMSYLTKDQWTEARIHQQKALCLTAAEEPESFTQIANACFPELEDWNYFWDLSEFR